MKITINYTGGILNLPAKVTEFTHSASKEELCFIINLFACPQLIPPLSPFPKKQGFPKWIF